MALLKINGVDLPNPISYKVSLSDLDGDNTGRNANGILIRDRVRAGVYKIDASWQSIKLSELKAITDAVSPAKFSVTFFDPTKSTNTTKDMYVGDRQGELSACIDEDNSGDSRWSLSLAFIEF